MWRTGLCIFWWRKTFLNYVSSLLAHIILNQIKHNSYLDEAEIRIIFYLRDSSTELDAFIASTALRSITHLFEDVKLKLYFYSSFFLFLSLNVTVSVGEQGENSYS